ncbi:MAG: glutamate--tRNA ligase [candidate division WOR-3 bacterium]|nr:glutamate--tRNA ligase [candidate division WOR-3 bacterium]MCX7947488.1 glutamate--tRNA ligase [candidate division WOR-3 bacterium]MDW8150647.1 glutamate--tRNA ligase [candidate division WOR-3 bacterium]
MVRVRFAPSPTGELHVGGARTALYNYLFARHNKGKFLLRIEDTDRERSKEEFVVSIKEGLKWLKIDWDEDIVYQSERLQLYKQYAYSLLEKNKAYVDYYYPEEWEEIVKKYIPEHLPIDKKKHIERSLILEPPNGYKHVKQRAKGAIRLFVEDNINISFVDKIRGKIEILSNNINDIVLLRTDETPTYNFAVVIDDYLMEITHIIRGDDHISNTPKQILIYNAFNWNIPEFAHLPMILGPDKKKLSKRHGSLSVIEYKKMGILSDALFNFLALLGWSPKDNREIISREEMIRIFKIEEVNSSPAVFDINKLLWMNSEYIKTKENREILELVKEISSDKYDERKLLTCIELLKTRTKTLRDFLEFGDYFLTEDYKFEKEAIEKINEKSLEYLKLLHDKYLKVEEWNKKNLEEILRDLSNKLGIKASEIIHPLRAIVSGKTVGPGLFEILEALGKEVVIRRLGKFIFR